ncbi:inositol monophosphatase family protein [Ekhidna sp.]|uniref:inositol monophosphatase family protein n=1 Tax=Ekhidna sp. TaxID=2608089 RepID=UPI003B504E7C
MKLCKLATVAAEEAGNYIQSQFDTHVIMSNKEGGDTLASQVVTEVDIKAQEIILSHLEASIDQFDLGLLTEESLDNQSRLHKEYFWCIDPMDGTLPYAEGKTGYSVSIALVSKSGDPFIGIVCIPDEKTCYSAIKGMGVKINGQPFLRDTIHGSISVYMDRSFTQESYFKQVIDHLSSYANRINSDLVYHDTFGGVRNAISVMNAGTGCYFKFPKQNRGCGSIWDYAATRLFFEELGLNVSTADGEILSLNNTKSTFMNESGIIYATDKSLVDTIKEIRSEVSQ